MELTRITRKYAYLNLTATGADGQSVTVNDVAVAVLDPYKRPDAATQWTTVQLTAGEYRILLAGPDASPTDAIVVPSNSNLWARVVDTPEVEAANLARITII